MSVIAFNALIETIRTKLTRYQLVLLAFVLLAWGTGFDLRLPATKLNELKAEEAAHEMRVDSAMRESDHRYWRQQQLLEGLVRLECYKEAASLLALTGLPCAEVGAPRAVR